MASVRASQLVRLASRALRSSPTKPIVGASAVGRRHHVAALSSRNAYPLSTSSSTAEIVGRPLPSSLTPRRALASPALSARSSSPRAGRCFASLQANAAVAAPAELKLAASPEVVEALGFEEVAQEFIDEYKANGTLYRHKKTGAEVMSVCCEDENKVFGIVFRTPVEDSTGIPHILEHSVLCGSRKYPVKEPFVELIKGSLHTFLNAFTYPDRTCYPVASTNLQDFYNLVDVYLDAVFFPNCVRDEKTFQQEGWHYELNETSEDITYKGVVFNEMKGVYSQPDARLNRLTMHEMFPDTTYAVDSGGDPQVIPQLTFKQFQDFHGKFYHPSNSRVWFYGDDDPDTRLRLLAEYLDQFENNPQAAPSSQVAFQPLFKEPKRVVSTYPVGEDEEGEGEEGESGSGSEKKKRHMVSLNWLLSDRQLSLEDELALGFLDNLLLGTPGAPLRKRLLESGLGEALVSSGLDTDLLQPSFHVGMKGVAEEDVGKLEDLIMEILGAVEREGFSEGAVEAAINSAEFAARENNTGSFPRGLSLMLRSMGWWIYNRDPFVPLKFEAPLAAFKARLAKEGIKGVFSPLIANYLIKNSHRVAVELQPDASLARQQEEEEKKILEEFKQKLQEQELEELVRATEELKLRQETPDPPEALKKVPSLALQDIPRSAAPVPSEVSQGADGVTFLRHDLFTNGVLYVDLALSMKNLPSRLLPYLPLFCQSLKEMGTKDMSFVEMNELVGRKTGGIYFYPMISSQRGSPDPVCFLMARAKATTAQAPDLLSLTRALLQDVQLTDQGRFKQFVAQAKQRKESGIIGSGHSVAASRIDAMDNLAGWANEQLGGLSSLEFLRSLEKEVESEWPKVQAALEEIRATVACREGAIVNLTADEATLAKAEGPVNEFLAALAPKGPAAGTPFADWAVLPRANEGLIVPTQVNYVGKGANLYSAGGYELQGSAYVASKVVGMNWLWDRVRVSGGAYGAFGDFDSHSGMYTFLSYRDPNLLKTLDNYDGAAPFMSALELDSDALTKAIIGTISDIDSYQLPDAKGYSSLVRYMLGITDEERQQRREQILSTTVKDLQAFGDVLQTVAKEGTVVTVASQSSVDAANGERPGLLEPKRVL